MLLISCMHARDLATKRAGALGCGNLATNPMMRNALVESGCLQPLLVLAATRGDDVPIDMIRGAVYVACLKE